MAERASPDEPLSRYRAKRDFERTAEPSGATKRALPSTRRRGAAKGASKALGFVVQKHWASRLHYDFRLEWNGTLASWAVPKGPSFDPQKKHMAVHVEDHPLDYASFEGTIPKGQYGAGTVIVWDRGTWEPVGDAAEGLAAGKLVFRLHGEKLAGLWELVRIAKPGDRQEPWLLFKKRDAWARPTADYDVVVALPDSVVAHPLGPVESREPREANAAGADASRAPAADASAKPAAGVEAPLPAKLAPQLATAVDAPPPGVWLVENKFDGYRLTTRIEHGKARLVTRGGHDWTAKMTSLAAAIEALGIDSAWLDGEIVVADAAGIPDFNALQNAIDRKRGDGIDYFVFDLPYHDGFDLRALPLVARRARLATLVEGDASGRVRLSPVFDAPPAQLLEAARQMGLEGIMMKRPDAPYVCRRSDTWLKVKCLRREDFVVCGYTDRSGGTREVGSLLLATWRDGAWVYAGNVGTGWDAKTARDLHARLAALATTTPAVPVASVEPGRWSRRSAGAERWVRPELVVAVAFREWTPDGHVRHAVFEEVRMARSAKDLRGDAAAKAKPAKAVAKAASAATKAAGKKAATGGDPAGASRVGTVRITHGERVIDASTGLTKLALVRYYESVAERILPHLKERPVSLVRAPEGIAGELFFQKHPETRVPGLRALDRALWPGHAALLAIDDVGALVAAAQMNTVELHTWNSTTAHIDRPDRVIFDLDPGEGVRWAQVQEAALLVHAMLEELGLASWLKTSGGKGLHVVVPLAPKLDDDAVKAFARQVVVHMTKTIEGRFVAQPGAAHRVGRIFIDYLRNGRGQTTVAAFSARARPGLGVSMPVAWEQLSSLKSGAQWTIATAREYLSFERVDPWAGYWKSRQTLTAARRRLDAATKAS